MIIITRTIAFFAKLFKETADIIAPPKKNTFILESKSGKILVPKQTISIHNGHRALTHYDDKNMKLLLHALKYEKNLAAAGALGQILLDILLEEIAEAQMFLPPESILVTHIPADQRRLRKRGYDHLELISKELEKNDVSVKELLRKIKSTARQTKLTAKERKSNLRGAFEVTESLAGKYIIVFDDITTTGATLNEARKTLKKSGAKKVSTIAICRAGF